MHKYKFPKLRQTVGFNLLKRVFSLYVIIALLITLAHMYSEYNNAKSVIMNEMKTAEKAYRKQLTSVLWELNYELLDEIIDGILTSDSIVGVSLKIKNDNSMGNFGIVDMSKKVPINRQLNKQPITYEKNLYSYTFELFDLRNNNYSTGVNFGSITLYSNESTVYNKIKHNFLLIIINSIIKTFALWIIFLYISKRYLTQAFFEIIETTNNIDFHHLEEIKFKYNIDNNNEFDILKNTFEKMIKRLRISFEHVKNANLRNHELNKDLEQKVQDRTVDLEESNDELEQTIINLKEMQEKLIESEKMASLGGLVAGVAHEINTPVGVGLAGITHFVELSKNVKNDYHNNTLSEDRFEKYLESSSKIADLIQTNLERTAQLVQSFKQVAVDQTNEIKRDFELKQYLEDIVLSLNNVIKVKKITVNIDALEKITLSSYPGLFSQIITNLIMNSVKHAFQDTKEGHINITINKKIDNLELLYEDNGKGISEENLGQIFDPFFTTNREQGGTGLGLNIIYNIITNQLKGTISCTSKINIGTLFTISLPLK